MKSHLELFIEDRVDGLIEDAKKRLGERESYTGIGVKTLINCRDFSRGISACVVTCAVSKACKNTVDYNDSFVAVVDAAIKSACTEFSVQVGVPLTDVKFNLDDIQEVLVYRIDTKTRTVKFLDGDFGL